MNPREGSQLSDCEMISLEESGIGKSRLNWAQVNFSMFLTAMRKKPPC